MNFALAKPLKSSEDWPTRRVPNSLSRSKFFQGGQGGTIERLFREARVFTVFAGSEEIMLDLGVKQALRQYMDSSAKL